LVDPHKQTLIDFQYFVDDLTLKGREVLVIIDANQSEEQIYQPQAHTMKLEEQIYQPQDHNMKFVTQKGFHVDGYTDGSLSSFMSNGGMINIIRQMHECIVPNTHARRSIQIDFVLGTAVLSEHALDV
jgi:hypothetical protein